jgi:hypothetical protein
LPGRAPRLLTLHDALLHDAVVSGVEDRAIAKLADRIEADAFGEWLDQMAETDCFECVR